MKRLPLFLALACGIFPVLQAEEGASVDRIREGEAKQQQLRGEAQRLVEQLDSMMDEYQRNQLGGEEIKTLQGLRDSLAKLSVDEMKQVVDLLEKARGARDAGEAKQRVADAYTSQKAILAQMAKLLADHLRNEQSQEFAQQLAQLAERQAVNLQNGITLGQWSDGKKPDNLEAAKEANLQGQQAEQTAISEELKTLMQRVAEFSKDPENADQARRLQKGLTAMQKVQPNVESAVAALKASQLFKAVGDEKTARDTMRQVARDIAPPPERAEVLRAAEKELAKAIEDQKQLAKDTANAAGEKDFDRWLDDQRAQQKLNPKQAKMPREQQRQDATLQKRFEAQKNRQPDSGQLAEMEKKQGEVAAQADELAQSLAKAAPEAARDIKAGTDKMQEARGALADKNVPSAMKNAQDALAAIQAADAKLQQEMAKAQALAGKSGDPVKDLQALQQQAQALAQQQAEAARNPDKAAQAALAQKVGELAKQAAAMAPAAAPAAQKAAAQAQQAAAQAQQAAQAAQAGQPAQAAQAQQAAAQAQQAAAQNLAQAAQQIAQQAAAAQQAQQQAAAAQQAQQQLAEIISAEQKLQIDTTKSAAATTKGKPVKRDAFAGQAGKQEEIDGQTAAFQKGLPQLDPVAKTALEEAQSAMSEAKKALEKPDGEVAKTAEAKAVEQLFAAQTGLQAAAAQAQAQAQQQMGQQPNAQAQAQANAAAAQQAAAQLAQAQAQIAQANQALQQAAQAPQPGAAQKAAQQAAAQLAKAAAQAGQAAAQAMPANAQAQQAIQAGAQAAAQGAAQAAAQNVPAAQAQAAAAGQALAEAQAALAQAQAGLTAANTPGAMPGPPGPPSGQPGQPGQPGQKPGQQPGKTRAKHPAR